MARTVVSLTDTKIKSEISKHKKSPDKAVRLSDGSGLFLLIDKRAAFIGALIISNLFQKNARRSV